MQSIEINKIVGALLLGGLVALITGLIADALIEPRHGETVAVAVPEGESTPAEEEAAAIEPVGPLLAAADVAAGEAGAKRCATCHTFDKGGPNKVGPNLWDIVGNKHGHMEGFAYSEAIAGIDRPWDYEELNHFLAAPRAYAPGTKMTFAGLKKVEDRANVIAWLRTLSDAPRPLPEAGAAPESSEPAVEAAPPEPAAAAIEPTAAETEAETEAEAEADGEALAARLTDADVAAGEKVAKRCAVCHSFDKDGANKIGPNLWNIVGAPTAHREDFKYSEAMAGFNKTWGYAELDAYLTAPKEYVPGNKMAFAGLKKPEDRANLIAWLRTLSDSPKPLP